MVRHYGHSHLRFITPLRLRLLLGSRMGCSPIFATSIAIDIHPIENNRNCNRNHVIYFKCELILSEYLNPNFKKKKKTRDVCMCGLKRSFNNKDPEIFRRAPRSGPRRPLDRPLHGAVVVVVVFPGRVRRDPRRYRTGSPRPCCRCRTGESLPRPSPPPGR